MTQNDLNRAVAQSTGETVTEIARRGFVPLDDLAADDEPPIDWDALEAGRNVITSARAGAERRRSPDETLALLRRTNRSPPGR